MSVGKQGRLKSVLVSSPLPGDGKSTTALNLATALAEKRTRSVLLVDADLHHGSITQQLNPEPYARLGGMSPWTDESAFRRASY